MYELAGDYINKYYNYVDPTFGRVIILGSIHIQRKPNNRELASPCQLICKIIHVSRERLVPYYRVFSVCRVRVDEIFIRKISYHLIHSNMLQSEF
jgi:hypothetical protein